MSDTGFTAIWWSYFVTYPLQMIVGKFLERGLKRDFPSQWGVIGNAGWASIFRVVAFVFRHPRARTRFGSVALLVAVLIAYHLGSFVVFLMLQAAGRGFVVAPAD